MQEAKSVPQRTEARQPQTQTMTSSPPHSGMEASAKTFASHGSFQSSGNHPSAFAAHSPRMDLVSSPVTERPPRHRCGGSKSPARERSKSPPSRTQPLRALVSPRDCSRDRAATSLRVHPAEAIINRNGDSYAAGLAESLGRGKYSKDQKSALPRVAGEEQLQAAASTRQNPKSSKAAMVAITSRPRGRGAVYYPSWFDCNLADKSTPDSHLELEYVHGYAGELPPDQGSHAGAGRMSRASSGGVVRLAATRSTNFLWLRTGELVYPASGVVVIHDFENNRQRFFTGHDAVRGNLPTRPAHC